jgi:apolipoprotein D and lipocalin family protein
MKIILLIAMLLPLAVLAQTGSKKEPVTVQSVDLERYTGLWYETAKVPNPFQKKCARNTTAEYTIRKDGKIDVVNRCTQENGGVIQVRGVAKIADKTTHARLKVSFVNLLGIRLFWGDYWIIGLDDEYRWAVVGDPSRKYGWILSRSPQMTEAHWEQVNGILRVQGYDPDRFVKTVQD